MKENLKIQISLGIKQRAVELYKVPGQELTDVKEIDDKIRKANDVSDYVNLEKVDRVDYTYTSKTRR